MYYDIIVESVFFFRSIRNYLAIRNTVNLVKYRGVNDDNDDDDDNDAKKRADRKHRDNEDVAKSFNMCYSVFNLTLVFHTRMTQRINKLTIT